MQGAPARLHVKGSPVAKVAGPARPGFGEQQQRRRSWLIPQSFWGFKSDRIARSEFPPPARRAARSGAAPHRSALHVQADPRAGGRPQRWQVRGSTAHAHTVVPGAATRVTGLPRRLQIRSVSPLQAGPGSQRPPRPQAGGAQLGSQAHHHRALSDRQRGRNPATAITTNYSRSAARGCAIRAIRVALEAGLASWPGQPLAHRHKGRRPGGPASAEAAPLQPAQGWRQLSAQQRFVC